MTAFEPNSNPAPRKSKLDGLITLLDREDTTANKIAEAIVHYPNLSAELLRQANSIQFALQRQIQSVERAINILGRQRILDAADRYLRHDESMPVVTRPHFHQSPAHQSPAHKSLPTAGIGPHKQVDGDGD